MSFLKDLQAFKQGGLKKAAPPKPWAPAPGEIFKGVYIEQLKTPWVPTPPQYSYGHWFNYFWDEALAARSYTSTKDRRDKLLSVFHQVFDVEEDPGSDLKRKIKVKQEVEFWPPMKKREILTDLLLTGFRAVPLGNRSYQQGDSESDCILGFKQAAKKGIDTIEIGYRSENRDWKTVQAHGGTRRKVAVDVLAKSMNMRAMWHPWSDPDLRDALWFRDNNQDNCLHSVISIGNTYQEVVSFPLVGDPNIYPLPDKEIEDWSPVEKETHKQYVAPVKLSNGEVREMLVTDAYVYLFQVRGNVIETQKIQEKFYDNPFPERGTDEIPVDHFVGYVHILRVHHGRHHKDGMTVLFVKKHLLPDAARLEQRLTQSGYKSFLQDHWSKIPEAPFEIAWTANGTGPAKQLKASNNKDSVKVEGIVKSAPKHYHVRVQQRVKLSGL